MRLFPQQVHQSVSLLRRDVVFISLDEDEKGLVPQNWHLPFVMLELKEMEYGGVHYSVRKRVSLVQQDTNEYGIRARVLHFTNLQEACGRVQSRNLVAGYDTAKDDGLAQGTVAGLQQGQNDALEKGGRLEERLFQSRVQV